MERIKPLNVGQLQKGVSDEKSEILKKLFGDPTRVKKQVIESPIERTRKSVVKADKQ